MIAHMKKDRDLSLTSPEHRHTGYQRNCQQALSDFFALMKHRGISLFVGPRASETSARHISSEDNRSLSDISIAVAAFSEEHADEQTASDSRGGVPGMSLVDFSIGKSEKRGHNRLFLSAIVFSFPFSRRFA